MTSLTLKYFTKFIVLVPLLIFCFLSNVFCQKKYTVQYQLYGKDTSYKIQKPELKTIFDDKETASTYISSLLGILLSKGFPAASVDSVKYDSTFAVAQLYLGEQFKWAQINTDSIDTKAYIHVQAATVLMRLRHQERYSPYPIRARGRVRATAPRRRRMNGHPNRIQRQ